MLFSIYCVVFFKYRNVCVCVCVCVYTTVQRFGIITFLMFLKVSYAY